MICFCSKIDGFMVCGLREVVSCLVLFTCVLEFIFAHLVLRFAFELDCPWFLVVVGFLN